MRSSLAKQIRNRAKNRCEYCLIHQKHDLFYTFPIDHIISEQHGGTTVSANLALSCLRCNLHKGPNIAGIDPVTRKLTALFDPRRHKWAYHFRLDESEIIGVTAIGRTTVKVLAMNHPDAVKLRESILIETGHWPA